MSAGPAIFAASSFESCSGAAGSSSHAPRSSATAVAPDATATRSSMVAPTEPTETRAQSSTARPVVTTVSTTPRSSPVEPARRTARETAARPAASRPVPGDRAERRAARRASSTSTADPVAPAAAATTSGTSRSSGPRPSPRSGRPATPATPAAASTTRPSRQGTRRSGAPARCGRAARAAAAPVARTTSTERHQQRRPGGDQRVVAPARGDPAGGSPDDDHAVRDRGAEGQRQQRRRHQLHGGERGGAAGRDAQRREGVQLAGAQPQGQHARHEDRCQADQHPALADGAGALLGGGGQLVGLADDALDPAGDAEPQRTVVDVDQVGVDGVAAQLLDVGDGRARRRQRGVGGVEPDLGGPEQLVAGLQREHGGRLGVGDGEVRAEGDAVGVGREPAAPRGPEQRALGVRRAPAVRPDRVGPGEPRRHLRPAPVRGLDRDVDGVAGHHPEVVGDGHGQPDPGGVGVGLDDVEDGCGVVDAGQARPGGPVAVDHHRAAHRARDRAPGPPRRPARAGVRCR